jgi:hypothetical protein
MASLTPTAAEERARDRRIRIARARMAIKFPRRRREGIGHALQTALDGAIASRELIGPAQELLREQPYIDNSPVERAAREYQIDLVAWQLNRAADIAQRRLRYIEAIRTRDQIEAENAKCAAGVEGTIHWFDMYAWGYDPRADSPLAVMPFGLFQFQDRYIRWLESLVFAMRASGLVEKARDMGATVGAINWGVKQWRYRPGFSALLSSATEDLVDSKKDPDTLFEKVRFQIKLLPLWMLPSGFDVDNGLTYMNIANPENGSVISGEAPTGKLARGRRRTVIICDEFQTYPGGGNRQYTAVSQSTRSVIVLGTPEGKFNKYADLRHSGHCNVFEMDWKSHPWKDKRWYDSLRPGYCGPPMTDQQIAQEIERNYDASQPGKVFPGWREEYCLITWSELVAYYKRFKLDHMFRSADGSYRVPYDWTWGRTHDHGQSEDHAWIVTHAARPRENYPLFDSVFVFSCHRLMPIAAAVGEAQPQIEKIERELGFRDYTGKLVHRYEFSENSHEADDVRKAFRDEHGEFWNAWSTDYNVGIPQIQEWLMLIQPQTPNPIRPELNGRSRIYFVAPDDEYRLALNETAGSYFVTPSKTDRGFKLLRREMPAYHYPASEAGKPVKDMRPLKKLDDTIDTIRAFATHWGPGLAPKTKEERVEDALPKHLRVENEPHMTQGRRLAREIALAEERIRMEMDDIGEYGSFWDGTS